MNAVLVCRAEDEKYSQSKAAQQRAEALQRAQEQAAENERNAKQAAREAFQRQRWVCFASSKGLHAA